MLQQMSAWFFRPAPPIHLQDTYVNQKHLKSAFLYKHGAS